MSMAGSVQALMKLKAIGHSPEFPQVSFLVQIGEIGLNLCGKSIQMKNHLVQDIHLSYNLQFLCMLSHLTLEVKFTILVSMETYF